jgi:tetratricopeptide (TPR) repeat protein
MDESEHKRARGLIRLGDIDGASRIVDAELQRCGDQGFSSDIWSLRCTRADLIRLRGDTEEALAYLLAKEQEFPPQSDDIPSLVELKKTRGYCLGMLGKYLPSDQLLDEAERMAKDAGLLEQLCEVWHFQAWFLYVRYRFEPSDRIFREILRTSEQLGDWYFRAIGLWGIGKNLMMRGHISNDALLLREALSLFEESHSLFAAAGRDLFAFGDMAVCYLDLGDDQKSLELLEKVLPACAEAGWIHGYQVTIANIGNVYRIRGDYLRAIEYYRKAVELSREINDPVSIQKWTHNIHLSYTLLRQSVEKLRTVTS